MAYQHGITVLEQATSLTAPIEGDSAIQVVFGTAPINLAEDPYSATNVPIIAYSYAEAVKQLGFSYDFKKYTLCQSIYASFQLYAVAPVIFVNVLDPKKHKKQNAASTVPVENMQATVQVDGILADTVSVKKDTESGTALKVNTDYVTEFDSNGYLVITLTATGAGKDAKSLSVTSTSIDPTAVTAADVVGGYNASTGAETGMELVRQIYPKFGVTPGLLLAPGWSHDPDVGLVLAAKCVEINGVFKCECIVDIDSTTEKGAKVYTEVKAKKEGAGVSSEHAYPLWPCFRVGSYILWASAVAAARTAYLDAANDNVPYLSPSNKTISITGTCLADGTEVVLDQVQANALNGVGVTTAINQNGWGGCGATIPQPIRAAPTPRIAGSAAAASLVGGATASFGPTSSTSTAPSASSWWRTSWTARTSVATPTSRRTSALEHTSISGQRKTPPPTSSVAR
jgi:hypothetical protein